MTPTAQEINALQGTRLNKERAPWETYAEELEVKMTPELAAEVADYATRFHDGEGTNQAREELAMRKEMNDASVNEYKWCTEAEYADFIQRKGRIMHSSEFINILRNKCRLKCWYRDHPQEGRVTLVILRGDGMILPEVGCWVQLGFAPELSVMNFDDHGVPLAEKYRGWRTCLLQLVIKGHLTEDAVNKYFGWPKQTDAYGRYNMTMHAWRNRGYEVESEL